MDMTVEAVDKLTGPVIGVQNRPLLERWTLLVWTPWYMLLTELQKTVKTMNA